MFYIKNVPVWERTLRFVVGLGIILFGLIGFGGSLVGWLLAISGLGFGLTGIFGFCPMCWMVGRNIFKNTRSNPQTD